MHIRLTVVGVCLVGIAFGTGAFSRAMAQGQSGGGVTLRPLAAGVTLHLDGGPPFRTTPNLVARQRVVDVEGSAVRVVLWDETDGVGSVAPYYGIAQDGTSVRRVKRATHDLKLRFAHFNPLSVCPPVVPGTLSEPSNSRLYLVQFETQALPEYVAALEALSVEIHSYIPNYAYLVSMAPQTRHVVASLPFVRWVGPYELAYRVPAELRSELAAGCCGPEVRRYSLKLVGDRPVAQAEVIALIRDLGGVAYCASGGSARMDADLTIDQLYSVLGTDYVAFADVPGDVGFDMDVARSISGAIFIESTLGFTGQGVRGEVFDGGLYTSHDAFNPNPLIHGGNSTSTGHGTKVYGVVFGDGTNSPIADASGGLPTILPGGQGIFASIYYGSFVDEPHRDCDWPY